MHSMTVEAKFTAGPFAEDDEWTTPISALAEQILNAGSADLPAPIRVIIQWPDGDELTYRRTGDEDEAWVNGYRAGATQATDDHVEAVGQWIEQLLDEEKYPYNEDPNPMVQVGWTQGSDYDRNFRPFIEGRRCPNLLADAGWEPVYTVS